MSAPVPHVAPPAPRARSVNATPPPGPRAQSVNATPRPAPRAELVIVREIRPVSGRFPLTIMKLGAAT
jgi:hypothetical protein